MKPLFIFIAIVLTHTAIATPDYSQLIQDQTCNIAIDYNGKTLFSSVYGFDEEPAALRLLLHIKPVADYKKSRSEKGSGSYCKQFSRHR